MANPIINLGQKGTQRMKTWVLSVLGQVICTFYALLFLTQRLPFWVKIWWRNKRKKGLIRSSKNSSDDARASAMPPHTLADPTLGRHMFVKIMVRNHRHTLKFYTQVIYLDTRFQGAQLKFFL